MPQETDHAMRSKRSIRPTKLRNVTARIAEERYETEAASLFARAVETGDLPGFLEAFEQLQKAKGGWPLALRRVAKIGRTTDAIRNEFLVQWIDAKMFPLGVGDRHALASALPVLFPRRRHRATRIYRGTTSRERQTRAYGFSWTVRRDVAQHFAGGQARRGHNAVVLETVAPGNAILQIIDGKGTSFDESEVVVDPFQLREVRVIERIATTITLPPFPAR